VIDFSLPPPARLLAFHTEKQQKTSMSNDDADEERPSTPWRPHRASTSAPDERDAKIERLEHILEDERQAAAELRETNEALSFRLQVLEKSYAKQLEDARLRCADVERQLAAQQAEFAALDAECRETMRLLAQTRAYLKDLAEGRAPGGRYRAPRDVRLDASLDGFASEAEGTINRLIADEDWPRPHAGDTDDAGKTGEHSDAGADSPPDSAPDSPPNDMIAPELVFTKEDRDDGAS
jgi:hypothetical protein